ncbi:glycosyltransferase [Paenibacillus sp. JX-17]|uniref:Glycosyltransferase n=1 Tax=Paenibacillus lacisoli TaxID=3064525 RepID=A0ABT9CCL0_9BACL|nr:glycosyltransferase [Paenibacillus sp. JX-17]MDO7906989.1 glycosyltransferase [Paenibacillus sp. JX-17]
MRKHKPTRPRAASISPAAEYRRGRQAGYLAGQEEGYLRGRANFLFTQPQEPLPFRQIHILYVSSGKGFPYSPIDEAIIATLQTLAAKVSVTDPRQPLVSQAQELCPDLLLALDGMEFPLDQIDAVRAMGIRTAVWLTDDPYYTDMTLNMVVHFDHVFTLEFNCVELYRQHGCPSVHYLPFAAFTQHYAPLATRSKVQKEVAFIGSAYWNRVYYFNPIMPRLMSKDTVINGIWWDRIPDYKLYQEKIGLGTWLGPRDTSKIYNGSKIVINLHRSIEDDSVNNNQLKMDGVSPNPRTFEINACATLQLTDIRSDLARFYEPGKEIETYSSPQELMDKIDYYLAHEEERREIALNGLARTLRDHTYSSRLNEMLTLIFP